MKASIKTDELIRVIKALKPFTGKCNPYYKADKMKFIHVEFDKDTQEARFEALDGHRIAVEYVKCVTEESFSAYIKPFNPWKTDAISSEIELDNGIISVDLGYYILKFKQPEGDWYDTKKMINATETIKPISRFGINPDYMIEGLKNINSYGCKKTVIIETRDKKEPVIIREATDRRNMRFILPVTIPDDAD